jgi:hypothetical protein
MSEDGQGLYAGEVELVISAPVNLKLASSLFNVLQTIPETRVINTRGNLGRGSVITVALDKPMPLISTLSAKLPEAKIIPDTSTIDTPENLTAQLPGSQSRKIVKRILLAPREADTVGTMTRGNKEGQNGAN